MTATKILLPLVLFLAGIAGGMLLNEHAKHDALSAVNVRDIAIEQQNALCKNSDAVKAIAGTDKNREFAVTTISTSPIADRALLCHVRGTLTSHLSGGRYSTATVERHIFLSLPTGVSEEITPEQYRYLQNSGVVKALASNAVKKQELALKH